MAHYAFLDENNIVTEVIVGVDENVIQTDTDGSQVGGSSVAWETFYGNFRGQVCKRTSYNGKIRKNYAGIGMIYDPINDWFYTPQPYPSWILNSEAQWQAPIKYPIDGKKYWWDESTLSWVEVIISA